MTRPAMGDERRWAARYQFLEQLWRGRDRIVCDRELEAALHAGLDRDPVGELLAGLVPAEGGDARAWVALHNDRRAVSYARSRSGTVFVSLDDAVELASDEPWEIALVNLDDAPPETLDPFLEILGERCEDDPRRTVVLTLACGDDEDGSYEELAELVEEQFGDGRVYGLTRPGMVAFYDFGPVLEPEGETEQPGEVGIEVDNSLGSEEPAFELFVAVVGARVPGEGVTFIELPAAISKRERGRAASGAGPSQAELDAVRVQLAEAQRRGDMQAIERQKLLEQLEQAEDRIASLDEELESQRGDEPDELAADVEAAERLDEALAREQTLRWELEQARSELELLRARPVETLEAEVESLRAKLKRHESGVELGDDEDDADEGEGEGELDHAALAEIARMLEDDETSAAQAREWMRARSKLDHLLRKLERGGRLSALELHRELSGLRKLL